MEKRHNLLLTGTVMGFSVTLGTWVGATALNKGSVWAEPLVVAGAASLLIAVICLYLYAVTPATPAASPASEFVREEAELGRRAVLVSRRVLEAHHEATQRLMRAEQLSHDIWNDGTYNGILFNLTSDIGASWDVLIGDLAAAGLLDNPNYYKIHTNFTGLDVWAREVEGIGIRLLRRHGLEPLE